MSPLEQKIIGKIRSEGPLNFETFMETALYYPGLGYYTKEATKIGKAGDFYTSSHLHPIFGAMLGRQMEEMWTLLGKPERFQVVEMGAGMGYLAKDMLDYLKGPRDIFPRIEYTIIEISPSLRTNQQELLKDHPERVRWISGLEELGPVSGCFLSNELLDAFPVRLVEMDDGLKEVYVSVNPEGKEGNFVEIKKPCGREVDEYFREYGITLPEGYKTEVNLRIRDWLGAVAGKLSEGFILTIDYGYPYWDYYGEDRNRGTLLCYYRHQVNENPYQHIGEQDMTAHVNFSSLKKWGEELGLSALGFGPQGTYLVSLGIDEVITELYGDSPDPLDMAKIKGLIMPVGMGQSHRIMIQCKGNIVGAMPLRGFRLRNQVAKL